MALIRSLQKLEGEPRAVHDEVEARYGIFDVQGQKIVQVNTYGRVTRDLPGKVSQTIQLDSAGAKALVSILKEAFGL